MLQTTDTRQILHRYRVCDISSFIPATNTSTIIHVVGQHMDTNSWESSSESMLSNV